jgi:hypothetical protein
MVSAAGSAAIPEVAAMDNMQTNKAIFFMVSSLESVYEAAFARRVIFVWGLGRKSAVDNVLILHDKDGWDCAQA